MEKQEISRYRAKAHAPEDAYISHPGYRAARIYFEEYDITDDVMLEEINTPIAIQAE